MTAEGRIDGSSPIDWRLRLSLGITAGWILLGVVYITGVIGWLDFATQQAPALGSFLEGAFAPLAFLWLVVGFFMQQSQLSQNTRAMEQQLEELRRSAQQAEVQSRHIEADELHSRQDTFLRVSDMVQEQLGVVAALLVISWESEGDREKHFEELLVRQGNGDRSAFALHIVSMYFRIEEFQDFCYGSPIRNRHTMNFREAFESLLARAGTCDPDGMIRAALQESWNGRVYRYMVQSDPRRLAESD